MDDTKGDRWFQVVDNRTFKIKKRIDMGQKLEEAGYPDQSSAVRPMALAPNERFVYFQVSFMHGFVEYDLKRDKVLRVAELPDAAAKPREQYLLDSAHHGLAMNPQGHEAVRRRHDVGLRRDREPQDVQAQADRGGREAVLGDELRRRPLLLHVGLRRRPRVGHLIRTEREVARIRVGDHPQRMRMGRIRNSYLR